MDYFAFIADPHTSPKQALEHCRAYQIGFPVLLDTSGIYRRKLRPTHTPQAIIVPVHFVRYREVSDQLFTILERFTPLVEPLSVDEAFLDVSASLELFGGAQKIALSESCLARAKRCFDVLL